MRTNYHHANGKYAASVSSSSGGSGIGGRCRSAFMVLIGVLLVAIIALSRSDANGAGGRSQHITVVRTAVNNDRLMKSDGFPSAAVERLQGPAVDERLSANANGTALSAGGATTVSPLATTAEEANVKKVPTIIALTDEIKNTNKERQAIAGQQQQQRVIAPIPLPMNITAQPLSSVGFVNGAANRAPARPAIALPKRRGVGQQQQQEGAGTHTLSVAEGGVNGGGSHAGPPPSVSSSSSALPASASNLRAWSFNGTAVTVPPWAPSLIAAIERSGVDPEALVAATEDPWRVLMGWSVAKPSSHSVNETLLKTAFGSSWSTEVKGGGGKDTDGGGKPFTQRFHLCHRNALTLLHGPQMQLHVVYISFAEGIAAAGGGSHWWSVSPNRPLAVYYNCRAPCSGGPTPLGSLGSSSAASSLSEAFPLYVSPLLTAGNAVMTPTTPKHHKRPLVPESYPLIDKSDPEGQLDAITCLDPLSAPWLVTTATVPQFPYEGLYDDLDALLAAQADEAGVVMVVMLNKFWMDHLHNFVFSLVHRAKFRHFIVAAIDVETLHLCIKARLPCFNAIRYAEKETKNDEKKEGHQKTVTNEMAWVKPRLTLAVLQRGYHHLMADLDMSFSFNFMRELVGTPYDFAHQCDTKNDHKTINSGFYLAKSNPRSIRLFHNIMFKLPKPTSDQDALKEYQFTDYTHGASNGCLDWQQFAMKCHYSRGALQMDNKTAKYVGPNVWNRHRGSFRFSMFHVVCSSGAHEKILYLRTMNMWFLDDLDAFTTGIERIQPSGIGLPPMGEVALKRPPTDSVSGDTPSSRSSDGGGYCVKSLDGLTEHLQPRSITTEHTRKYPRTEIQTGYLLNITAKLLR